jgi:tetratricopeptide (TPR) repeat protein
MINDSTPPLSKALQRFMGFLAQDPTNVALLNDALGLAIDSQDLASGQSLIAHAKTYQIDDGQFHAQAAHLSLMAGDFAAAAKHGSYALDQGIQHPAVIFNTAFGYFYSGQYLLAAELLAPLCLSADCPVATLMLYARALHHLQETEKAQMLVEQALRQEPEHIEARGLLALLHYDNDDNEAALQIANETLAVNPDQLDALIACGAVHTEQENFESAREIYTHTVTVHPVCGRAWSGLGQLSFQEMDFDNAEHHLLKAVEYMPNHIGTWHLLAWIYILRGDSAKARKMLDRSYALDRNFGETHGGLAVVDVMDGQEDKARTGIRRALKLNPLGMAAQYAQLLLLQKAGDDTAASQLVDSVLNRKVNDSSATGWQLINQRLTILKGMKQ